MNLDYYILWYEDNDEYFESAKESLELWFDELGFRLHTDRYKKNEELNSDLVKGKYDLIIVDLNLNGPDNGDIVIKSFRDRKIYTEVIFYSAKGADVVREAVLTAHGIDGVYCADKRSFNEDVIEVIETTIKKILSVNGMRGLTMAAASELDQHIGQCLSIHYDALPEEGKTIATNEIKKMISGMLHNQKKRFLKKCDDLSFHEVLTDRAATGNLKLQALERFLDYHSDKKGLKECRTKVGCYRKDIQGHRNVLAHVVESIDNGNKVLKNESTGECYDDDKFKEIRRSMIEHETNFTILRAILNS